VVQGEPLATDAAAAAPAAQPQSLRFFHGTSWERAQQIQTAGFLPSESGCLGAGVYVAREDKARRFAQNSARNGGAGGGGLVEVVITFSNPKFVDSNDTAWQEEGHDACRAEHTAASTNMEWCVKSASQVRVVRITPA
jgi:hypothetical protein